MLLVKRFYNLILFLPFFFSLLYFIPFIGILLLMEDRTWLFLICSLFDETITFVKLSTFCSLFYFLFLTLRCIQPNIFNGFVMSINVPFVKYKNVFLHFYKYNNIYIHTYTMYTCILYIHMYLYPYKNTTNKIKS